MLPRLLPLEVQQFIDSVTFSELAVDNITLESRLEIVNRALRFARQQDAAHKKKGIYETQEDRWSLFLSYFLLCEGDCCVVTLCLLKSFISSSMCLPIRSAPCRFGIVLSNAYILLTINMQSRKASLPVGIFSFFLVTEKHENPYIREACVAVPLAPEVISFAA